MAIPKLQNVNAQPRFLAFLGIVIGLFPHGAHAQDPSASEILKKVAERYSRISSLSVVSEKKVDLDPDASGVSFDDLNSGKVYVGSHQDHEIQVRLMESSASRAKLVLKDGKKEILVVRDGNAFWTLIPSQHKYTRVIERRPRTVFILGDDDVSGSNLLREYEVLVLNRFQSIPVNDSWGAPTDDSWTIMKHSEALKVGQEKKACYVLTRKGSQGSKNKLWVDKTEFVVWKSVDTDRSGTGDRGVSLQTTVTMATKQLTLNPSLDERNLVFTAPDRAKRVDSLRISGNPF
jgi:outer membrane lipoprotein-sorting protein